jgi:predicted esterase
MKFPGLLLLLLLIFAGLNTDAQKLHPGPQVLTFFSDVDDTEQPYGLYIPPNYDSQKKYPLVVMLHGAGSNHRLSLRRVFGKSNAPGENDVEATRYFPEWANVNYIVVSPYARGTNGYQGVSERDVWAVLADVKKRFNVDEDRTYLTGLSMGGGGTLWIGLTRPDVWAALAPVCPAPPKGTENYQVNAFNLPIHFFHGDADKAVPVTVSRDWVKKLKEIGTNVEYNEYPGVEHNSWENAYKDEFIFSWFSKFTRNLYPAQVKFSSAQYAYNSAYWVRFDKLTPGTPSSIDANFTSPNKLAIATTNLDAFTLKLQKHPSYKSDQPLEVMLNGKKIKITAKDSVSFQLVNGKWTNALYQLKPGKQKGFEGPISAAIASRHVYVYGTGGNPTPEELKARQEVANKAANWSAYRNAFLGRVGVYPRVVSDKEIRPSDLASCDLVLFGTKETNAVIEKFGDKLPVHFASTDATTGLLYVYPVEGHYVLINSGMPWWEGQSAQGFFSPLPHQMLNSSKDFVVYKGSLGNVVVDGYFDENWQLTAEQKAILAKQNLVIK